MEASAQEEIREILERNEELERKRAESKALREQEAKERENMGVMWGMGECVLVRLPAVYLKPSQSCSMTVCLLAVTEVAHSELCFQG